MLSSISSFLPAALQISSDKSPPPPSEHPQPIQPPVKEEEDMAIDEHGVKKKKERTNESFIVVRPPPSKTNHPLNLQVQLVPPSNRDLNRSSNGRRSLDSSVGQDNEEGITDVQLTRTSSNRSEVSMYSSYSSASISSVASTSTASSGRRMIIPLYNLQAHSVLTNIIVDAGTDAKVAKFQKRGLEVIGLAILEAIEVWGEGGNPTPLPGYSPNLAGASLPDYGAPRRSADLASGAHTPTSSALSLTSDEYSHTPAPVSAIPSTTSVAPTTPKNTPGTKKFFGKLFKRRGDSPVNSPAFPPSPLPPITAQPPSPAPSTDLLPTASTHETSRVSGRSSQLLGGGLNASGHSPAPSASDPPVSAGIRDGAILQPPILGLQPTLSSPSFPPRGRPTRYVWVIRKWLKGTPESLLGGMKDKIQQRVGGLAAGGAIEGMVEVRFEWSRGKDTKRRRGRKEGTVDGERAHSKRHSLATSSPALSTTSLGQQGGQPHVFVSDAPLTTKNKRSSTIEKRRSMESHRSGSPGGATASVTTASEDDHLKMSPTSIGDDGDESEPEDSETPWTCTLIVRRLSPSRFRSSAGADAAATSSSTCKVKVAGVVPTPHHPKVVALLKVPFPLPDIEVERANVRKRIITPAGVARPATFNEERPGTASDGVGSGSGHGKLGGSGMKNLFGSGKESQGAGNGAAPGAGSEGLVLTAEEIKDIVSTTALWLVVREGFGGVGRVSRKGDGSWRMR